MQYGSQNWGKAWSSSIIGDISQDRKIYINEEIKKFLV